MTQTAAPQRCPGCGSLLAACDGPVHAYMLSTPACWQAFGALVAREYADPGLMEVHRLTVDAWAVQHPGDGSRRAIQSVGLHLCRLTLQLEHGFSGRRANDAMLRLGRLKAQLPALPPRASYRMTVADMGPVSGPDAHAAAVRRWARSTWEDWADQHGFVAEYLARSGLGPFSSTAR